MNRIPLSEFLHINRVDDGPMRMEFGEHAHNHIRTAHASAQYALAEFGTGALLADLYPGHHDKLFAVLRRGELKYGKAEGSVASTGQFQWYMERSDGPPAR